MKAAVRCRSLTLGGPGPDSLSSMEAHGKRLDGTGRMRRVRDAEPLVVGSLDLRSAYDAHVKGARRNAGLKRPVLHFVCQFPTALQLKNEKHEQWMLDRAVEFVDGTHGGQAVFAARLDRDEAGRHTVDVFATPKYEKRTKRTPPDRPGEVWISTTRHGKQLCSGHREEIERRHNGKFLHGPRQVGMALQSEWADFLRRHGCRIDAKTEKAAKAPDRLSPELLKKVRNAKAELAEIEKRRMSSGSLFVSLLTGDLSRREGDLLAGEAELKAKADRQEARLKAAADRQAEELAARKVKAEAELEDAASRQRASLKAEADRQAQKLATRKAESDAGIAVAADLAEARGQAMQAIAEQLVVPAEQCGKWLKGERYDQARWTEVRPTPPGQGWTSPVWADLRRFAAAVGSAVAGLGRRIADLTGQVGTLTAERDGLKRELESALPAPKAAALRREAVSCKLLLGIVTGQGPVMRRALAEGAEPDGCVESAGIPADNPDARPLHVAARWGSEAAVDVLLKAGADRTLPDSNGQTPLDVALTAAITDRLKGPAPASGPSYSP